MRAIPATVIACVFLSAHAGVYAFPDGAPWGAANPVADQNCATCHFEYDAVNNSSAITLDGWPSEVQAGQSYNLTLHFDDPETIVSGFQIVVESTCGDAGVFVSAPADVEFLGAAIRSSRPLAYADGVAWPMTWNAPAIPCLPIVFHVAVTASNDDGSPFGDIVHFRSFILR